MCDFNGPFRLCTCSSDIDYTKAHWVLRMNTTSEEKDMMVRIGMMMPLNLISKIEMGELDAGIVYHSDCVNAQKNKRALCVSIPADMNSTNGYYVAALNSRNVTQQFVDFVSSPAFTTTLQSKYGFLAP